MEIQEKRQFKRLKANLPVFYEDASGTRDFGETVSKDISTTGLRMNMNTFFAPETSFHIRLRFPEVSKIIEGMAKIVWSHRISFSDQYQAGLQFYELNPICKKWLEEYILINNTLGK